MSQNLTVANQATTNIKHNKVIKKQTTKLPALITDQDLTHDALAIELGHRGFYKYARYVHSLKKWYLWNKSRWLVDDKRKHFSIIGDFLRGKANTLNSQLSKQKPILSDAEYNQLQNWTAREYKNLRSAPLRSNIETLIKSDQQCVISTSIFDANPLLIGTPKGTIDLQTGVLSTAKPNDYITQQTSVAPETGDPKVWLQFLNETFNHDQELIGFMQRLCGYVLTGLTSEEKLFFLYGTGANGKSKFLETIFHILGDYASRAPASLFMEHNNNDHPTAIAGLKNARLVIGSELPSGKAWNEQVIKDLTGGDTVTARLMRQDYSDYKPQFSILIAGNHQPQLKNVDDSIVRRMVMIPFANKIPESKRDVNLGAKLKAESEQIFNWCIEGSVEYFKQGLKIPQTVLDASASYIKNVDVTGDFIDSKIIQNGGQCKFADVFKSYKDWMQLQGHSSVKTEKQLRAEFKNRSITITRSNNEYKIKGYSLI